MHIHHCLLRLFLNRLDFEMSTDQRKDHALQVLQQQTEIQFMLRMAQEHQVISIDQSGKDKPVLGNRKLSDHLGLCSAVLASKTLAW